MRVEILEFRYTKELFLFLAIKFNVSLEIYKSKFKKMKTNTKTKFDLEKMKVAKLKNIHLINGGYGLADDPINTTIILGGASSRVCAPTK